MTLAWLEPEKVFLVKRTKKNIITKTRKDESTKEIFDDDIQEVILCFTIFELS